MAVTFQKVAVNTMRSIVADAIRKAIVQGALRPGERIVERNLAAQFAASLSVIREALVELEMDGFIVKRRNTATYVTQLSVEDAAKVFELRAVLEPYAIGQAARKAKPADIRDLEEIHGRMCACAREGDLSGYLREYYTWHDRVWQICDNEYVRASLARALVPFFAFFAIRCPTPPFDMMKDAEEHRKIIQALEANDSKTAEGIIREAMSSWRTRPKEYADPLPAQD